VAQLISQNFHLVIFVVLLSPFLHLLIRSLAIKVSLVDIPNERKDHQNQTPLTGGISIFLVTFLTLFIFFETISIDLFISLVCGGCMLTLGIIDDKFDLSAYKKLFFQILISLTFIIVTDYEINDLGTPLGFSGPLELGLLSVPFTLFAIIGLTNAINMIDGCDGLASSLIIISLLALLIFETAELNNPSQFLLVLVSSLIVFLFFNFSNNKNIKIFLGDSGSLFLGFIVATSLVKFGKNTPYDSSIVLWFSAVIIFDFCAVIVMRKLQKRKIFTADRNHIHHLLLSSGLSHFQTTALISAFAVVLLLFGVTVTTNHPNVNLWSFFALFLLYLSFRIFTNKAK
jgi:undecaprenyl-phosphate alpha-N-acetylglucosaminyl 1-phosphatetransferase